jgi:hypothetical protein
VNAYPISILRNVFPLGVVESDQVRFAIASGEIDVSTDVGKLIYEMATEIDRLARSLRIVEEKLQRLRRPPSAEETVQHYLLSSEPRVHPVPEGFIVTTQTIKLPV